MPDPEIVFPQPEWTGKPDENLKLKEVLIKINLSVVGKKYSMKKNRNREENKREIILNSL